MLVSKSYSRGENLMTINTKLLFVHALSPLHAGTGQSIGAIDLAIARDRATGMPYLPGSSLKGSLRARAAEQKLEKLIAVFGPETNNASEHAGAIVLGDANLLLLPVRSVAGTYAWVTSPLLLDRYTRDAREAGLTVPAMPRAASVEGCLVAKGSKLKLPAGDRVVFEDLDFKAEESDLAGKLADELGRHLFPDSFGDHATWRDSLKTRLCVVHDDVMSFLAQHGTDVVARIALDAETKTVKGGQLWYEENLPSECVLLSIVGCVGNGKATASDVFQVLDGLTKGSIQLGGKATVGRGRCQLRLGGGK